MTEHSLLTETQDRKYMGIPKENKVGRTMIYARVSNQSQKEDESFEESL